MQTRLAPEIKEIIGKIPFLPTVTIVMPFNPKMDTGKHLQESLAYIRRKVNDLVFEMYEDDLSILVLQKLDGVFRNLNTSTPLESVAIFLSPVFEKVLYLNYPVETYIGIDENFSIHQAVINKKRTINYLVLDLTFDGGRLCLGNERNLIILKNNSTNCSNNIGVFNRTDKELRILMEAYSVPVFVIGNTSQLSYYRDNTLNSTYIIRYIPENKEMSMQNLFSTVSLYFKGWDAMIQQFDMNQVKAAAQKGVLSCGITNVSKSIKHHKPVKLFISEVYANEYNTVKAAHCRTTGEKYYNRYSYVKNNLDELIENVLISGGKVNFVQGGIWDGFHQICMIYR